MGEFNVDKSTGNLKLTAGADNYTTISYANWLTLTDEQKENGRWDVVGVPANEGYTEADKCMMSDGVTSVEDAVDGLKTGLNNKVDIYGGGVVNAYDSVDLSLPSVISCYLLFTFADNPNIYGSAYMLQFTFNGMWVAIELGKGDALGMAVTGGSNKVTVANSTGFNCYYQVVKIA